MSKKIIFGIILLIILAIGVYIGIPKVMKSVKKDMSTEVQDQLSDLEITTFNQKFLKYEGTDITGSMIKALLKDVEVSNNNGEEQVSVEYNNSTYIGSRVQSVSNFISASKKYKVSVEYGDSKLISTILIEEK